MNENKLTKHQTQKATKRLKSKPKQAKLLQDYLRENKMYIYNIKNKKGNLQSPGGFN